MTGTMSELGRCVLWVLLLSTSGLMDKQIPVKSTDITAPPTNNSPSTHTCDYVFKVKKGSIIDLNLHNFTQRHRQNHYCTVQATAEKHMRIVVDLVYSPPPPLSRDDMRLDCSSDYVHLGNDLERLDIDLLTSYKFCGGDVHHELVSGSNRMWMVFKASRPPRDFFVKVWAHTPVTCTPEQFRCSPVQCVDMSMMCDGVRDCTNGHDEFCHRPGTETQATVHTEACFRCGDGTCILPRLSRYDQSYGRVLWYLCDGFGHCPDAWDEREDICRGSRKGLLGSVVKCVPSDLQFGVNGSVLMWKDVQCNSVLECHHGEDEKDCNRQNFKETPIHADPATLCVVVGILVTGCTLFCVIYRLRVAKRAGSRPSTSSTVDTKCTQMTSSDNDRAEVTSSGPAANQAVFFNKEANLQTPINDNVNNNDEEDEEDEGVASSLTSLDLRHTVV